MSEHARIEEEQKYFDTAVESLRREVDGLASADHTAADNKSQIRLRKVADDFAEDARLSLEDSVAVGRFSVDPSTEDICDGGGNVYIGRHVVHGHDDFPLVINWRADAAQRFYTADHRDSSGVIAKRTYDVERNRVLDFEEVVFAELARSVEALTEPQIGDALLSELERGRSGRLRDIVRTIQAAQYEIIRADPNRLLVVQGGPGTGKSVVALHRVSWLLYNHPDTIRADEVLVVGPNTAFIRYVQDLLPALGDRSVPHKAVQGLGPSNIRVNRDEPEPVVALKGQLRMEALLERGLDARITVPDETDFVERGRVKALPRVRLDGIAEAIERFKAQPYATGRRSMRTYLRDLLTGRVDPASLNNTTESFLDRVWPQLTPMSFLQDLLGSSDRLLDAAGDDFRASEIKLLHRRSAESLSTESWSEADIPLLDFADLLINGRPSSCTHIVVDEAQDLSPMQLRSIARRSSNGSMTVLGDIAQSTGNWARDDWDEIAQILASDLPVETTELNVGYRVPAQAFALAADLLPVIAPSVTPPDVIRQGPEPRFVHATDDQSRALSVAELADEFASSGAMVGVICPEAARSDVIDAFDAGGITFRDVTVDGLGDGVNLVEPQGAKGLEFDAVVIVEPELLIESDRNGGRLLYVALTRTIRDLAIVHVGAPTPVPPLPTVVEEGPVVPDPQPVASDDLWSRTTVSANGHHRPHPLASPERYPRPVLAIARLFAEELRQTVVEDQIPLVLEVLSDELATDRQVDVDHGGTSDPSAP